MKNFFDLNGRKKLEAEMRAASAYARNLIEASLDPLVTISTEGKITDVNKSTEMATGLPREQLIGSLFSDYFTQPDKAKIGYEQAFSQGVVRDYPLTLRHSSGKTIDVLYNASVYKDKEGNVLGVFAAARDVSEKNQIEQDPLKSKKLLDETGRLARVGAWEMDLKAGTLYWSEITYSIHEVESSFVPNLETAINFYAPEAIPVISNCVDRAIKFGEPFDVELELITAKKNRLWVRAIGEANKENGETVKVSGVFQDIDQIKRANLELQLSKQKLALHAKNTPLGIIEFSVEGTINEWNVASEKIFGFTEKEAIGSQWTIIAPERFRNKLEGVWESIVEQKGGTRSTNENQTKDHKIIMCEWFNTPLINNEGKTIGIASLVMDITDQLKAQEELKTHRDQLEDMVKARTAALTSILSEVKDTVNILVSSTSEILAATTQVASGSIETSSAISETTTTVEEVRQAAQLSSKKANNVSENAQEVSQITQLGQNAVNETLIGMHEIQTQMDTMANTIVRLSEQTQQIGGIIASVTEVADKSNMLAVNAAIEAAKAGEQGKGFAVVAQEIKSLAQQSKEATIQVRNILNDVQKTTSAAVMATEQTSRSVDNGVKQSAQAGDAIKKLAESSSKAVESATQIVASSQQQVVGMDQIGLAMQNINQASTENAASMSQAEKAAKELNELGQKLKLLVEQHKI